MEIEPALFFGGLVSVGGFVAWVIRYLLQDIHQLIEQNTEALTQIKLTIEKCKFVQGLEK